MRKLLPLPLIGLVAAPAAAQILYEPFDYAAGNLEGQINPGSGRTWNAIASGADISVIDGSLAMPSGMPAAVGRSVSYIGSGKGERLGFGGTYNSGTLYYSFALKVTDLSSVG